MAAERERMVMLEEFMKNTGADRNKALNVLNRNQWNLIDSYSEIEKMCTSSGPANRNAPYNNQQRNRGQPPPPTNTAAVPAPSYNAIEMGLGAAVNLVLRKEVSSLPQHQQQHNAVSVNQPHQSTNTAAVSSSYGLENLSVKLPSNNKNTTAGVATTQQQHHQQQRHPSMPPASGPGGQGQQHPQHGRVSDVSRIQQDPSRPSMVVAPSGGGSGGDTTQHQIDEGRHEDEDVFDEQFVSKKPFKPNAYPRLKRGFSNIIENEDLVTEARHNVQTDILKDSHDNMYVQTFTLPNLAAYKEGFRAFVEKELIETSTLVSLEQAGRLNWWAEMRISQRLMPMATSGDGNCLLHAASLAMWGIHDRQLILRNELHETLTRSRYKDALYRRWRYQQTLGNKESGLLFSEAEWKEEWENVLRLASPLPRGARNPNRQNNCCDSLVTQGCQESVVYESLEEFHVFVLAHVLQRPIIIVADTFLKSSSGEALAPIPFSGIYLPFEVHPCYRSPLLLTYDAAHFSALVPIEQDPQIDPVLPAAIPLVDPQLKLLPLHFCLDPLSNISKHAPVELTLEDKVNLLKKMLDVERIPFYTTDSNGDSDIGSCGSHESDESGPLPPPNSRTNDKDKKKEKEEKKKQGQTTVAKQFGSLGKTVGKKLKQLGKGNKEKPRRPSITQSTAITSLEHYSPRDVVLVARLCEKKGKQQQEMIQNYLQDAHARFKLDHELKRKSDIELRSKVAPHPAVTSAVKSSTTCKTTGCFQIGVPEAGFYCSKCNAARQRDGGQQQQQSSHLTPGVNQYSYNTFPGRGRQQNLSPDEIFCCGNSKFYTSSNEDVNNPDSQSSNLNVSDKNASRSSGTVNQLPPRGRSPSPDYDNVEYGRNKPGQVSSSSTVNSSSADETRKCLTAGCEFFGNRASDFLCSKCYQKKYQAILDRATQHSTKL